VTALKTIKGHVVPTSNPLINGRFVESRRSDALLGLAIRDRCCVEESANSEA